MDSQPLGALPPRILTAVPGPRSGSLARRLARVESRNITCQGEPGPLFWQEARGANVRDVDGNVFVDLTAGFGVAAAGHARPEVAGAIAEQARTLAHGLGDVAPPEIKVRLLEKLAALAPGDLEVSILGSSGAEAVEAALKTALLATGKPGVISFHGAYHGLSYGALALGGRPEFRRPFERQLFGGVRFVDYPSAAGAGCEAVLDAVLAEVRSAARGATPIGALVVEPILGRGGLIEPPADFLPGLRRLCDERELILVVDEIYTGFGRTGRWFACEHVDVVPDVMTVGKALTGALPLSAAIARPSVMEAWPASEGEALHTSTFLGNPIGCAAALAQIEVIEREGLVERSARLGAELEARLERWRERYPRVAEVRGRGLLSGVALVDPDGSPDGAAALRVSRRALARGVIVLSEGPHGHVLALTPALSIPEPLLAAALEVLEEEIAAL